MQAGTPHCAQACIDTACSYCVDAGGCRYISWRGRPHVRQHSSSVHEEPRAGGIRQQLRGNAVGSWRACTCRRQARPHAGGVAPRRVGGARRGRLAAAPQPERPARCQVSSTGSWVRRSASAGDLDYRFFALARPCCCGASPFIEGLAGPCPAQVPFR